MLNFFQIFDGKFFANYTEEGVIVLDETPTQFIHQKIEKKISLKPPIFNKLVLLLNNNIAEDLKMTFENIKTKGNRINLLQATNKLHDLFKLSSICAVFSTPETLLRIHEYSLEIVDEILNHLGKYKIHFSILGLMIDLFHGMFKAMKWDICEQIIDIIFKAEDDAILLFATRIGHIIPVIDEDKLIQKKLLHKLADIFNKMLGKNDFLLNYKALEGIVLVANDMELDAEDLLVVVPQSDEGKGLLKIVATLNEEEKNTLAANSIRSMIDLINERSKTLEEVNSYFEQQHQDIESSCTIKVEVTQKFSNSQLEEAVTTLSQNINEYNTTKDPNLEPDIVLLKQRLEELLGKFKK